MCADITNYYDENSIHTAYYYSCKIASFISPLLVCVWCTMYDEQGGSRLYVKLGKLGPGIAGEPRLPYSSLGGPP